MIVANVALLGGSPVISYFAYWYVLGLPDFVTMDWGLLVDGLFATSQFAFLMMLGVMEFFFGTW